VHVERASSKESSSGGAPLPKSEAKEFFLKYKIMEIEELKQQLNVNDLIFVSRHDNVVGSLYFRKVDGENVYRGRIRLVHEQGPQITYCGKPEAEWFLVTATAYAQYQHCKVCENIPDSKDKKSVARRIIDNEEKLAVLTLNRVDLARAAGKTIYEIYTHGSHPSRGALLPVKKAPILQDLTQGHINAILDAILTKTGYKGNCKELNAEQIKGANEAIIALTNKQFPAWIKQVAGKYGC
jgi:hypothetical protein